MLALLKDLEEVARGLEIQLLDWYGFCNLVLRFSFNMTVILIIMHFFYYRGNSGRKEYFFTNVLIGTVVFILCFLLESVKLQLGFALGLFAVFGIIRYRTDTIPIKEMTYLFCVIGISILNALSNEKVSYAELLFSNVAVVCTIWFLEIFWMQKKGGYKLVVYERIELIPLPRRDELIADLRSRTGLDITHVTVGPINFLRDTADLEVYYNDEP